jgi:hypothetical protein
MELHWVLEFAKECFPSWKEFVNWIGLAFTLFMVLRPPVKKLLAAIGEVKTLFEHYPEEVKHNHETREQVDGHHIQLQEHGKKLDDHHNRITTIEQKVST